MPVMTAQEVMDLIKKCAQTRVFRHKSSTQKRPIGAFFSFSFFSFFPTCHTCHSAVFSWLHTLLLTTAVLKPVLPLLHLGSYSLNPYRLTCLSLSSVSFSADFSVFSGSAVASAAVSVPFQSFLIPAGQMVSPLSS